MLYLRQSTASQSVLIGPFVDDGDGNTPATGLTIDAADIRLSKNGANIAAKNSGGGTHDELGYYTITLDATDTNTVGRLQLMVHESGALPVYHEFWVLEEAVFDDLFAASAPGIPTAAEVVNEWESQSQSDPTGFHVNVLEWTGNAVTASSGNPDVNVESMDTGVVTAGVIAADAIGASELAADAVAEIADAVWDEAQSGHTTGGTFGEIATEIASILDDTDLIDDGTSGLAKIATDVAAILVDTADMQPKLGTPSDLGGGATLAANLADIEAQTDDIGAAGAGLTALATAAELAKVPKSDSNVTWNATAAAQIQSEATDALNAYDPPTNAEMEARTLASASYATATALQTVDDEIATIDSNVDAILADTADMQPKIGTPTDFGSGTSTIAANLQDLADNGTATYDRSTDSLQAIRDRGDAAWTTGGGGSSLEIASGTIGATGNDTTHLHLDGLAYADDALNDLLIVVYDDSAGLYYSTWITDWANTGDLATVNTLPFTPEASTDTYVVLAIRQDVTGGSGLDAAGVRDAIGLASANLDSQLAALPTAAEVVNEWESQSQADPTGFHVNVMEVGGTAQTANDNGADINAILADTNELQGDWANGGRLDNILDARASQTSVDDLPTNSELATALDALPTAAENADAVWDEDATGHQTGGTFGQAIGDPGANTETIYDAVVTDAAGTNVAADIIDIEGKVDDLEGRLTATRAGYLDNLSGGAVALEATAQSILTDTAEIGAAGAGLTEAGGTGDQLTALATATELAKVPKSDGTATWNATALASIQSEANDALVAYDPPTKAELDSGLAGLNDLSAAEVNAEVDTALADYDGPTKTEMDTAFDAVPTAVENADALLGRNIAGGSSTGRTVKQALRALRNKVTRSGGTITVYQEDDTTSDWTAAYTTDETAEPITEIDPG